MLAFDAAPVKGSWLVGVAFPPADPVPVGFDAEPVPVGYIAAETVPLLVGAYAAVAVAARAARTVIWNCILVFVWMVGFGLS
jgi:hypothetical protein